MYEYDYSADSGQELIEKRKFIPRSPSKSKLNASDYVEGDGNDEMM